MHAPAQASDTAIAALQDQVRAAVTRRTPLRIHGGDTKRHLGREVSGQPLDTRPLQGIVSYEPTELVATVRAGTPLRLLEDTVMAQGQRLAWEPPHLGEGATVGGAVACGLSGPRRPWSGALRDFVLGCRIIDGQGRHLRFGGEVMKNVAGYDVSRLLAGSQGCLGVITEVSLKILPRPLACRTLCLELDAEQALEQLAQWASQPLPISGAAWLDGQLHLRLEGGHGSVAQSAAMLGGEAGDEAFWNQLREQQLSFFERAGRLWRLSLPPATAAIEMPGEQLIDWAGAQRWLLSDAPEDEIRALAAGHRGHASGWGPGFEVPHPPPAPALLALQQRLKAQFDPHGLFNPGRLFANL